MKLLLLQPLRIYKRWPMPEDFTGLISSTPTLAFPQLAAVLKDHDIKYLDGIAQDHTLAELSSLVREADAVLINAHSSIGAMNVEANVRHIIQTDPEKVIILGGHHATEYDFEWLGRGVHFVVRHEGERTIKELVEAIENHGPFDQILGLSWRDSRHEFHRNPDRPLIRRLDDIPIPDWSILNPKLYHLPLAIKGYATTMESSRGCPHRCKFCVASRMWFNRQRFKSAERVLEELRILNSMGFRKIWIADDNFGSKVSRDVKIYEGILREGIKAHFMAFIRADSIVKHPDVIELAAKAGFRAALVGYETPVQRVLDDFDKQVSGDTYAKTSEILRKNGIFVSAFMMVGYLNETQEETDAVFRASEELTDYPIISIFEPRLGTPDFLRSMEEDEIPGGDMFYHNTVDFIRSKKHILKQYRRFYSRYLTHPNQVRKLLFGTPTEKAYYRVLYFNMLKSAMNVTPAKLMHAWDMVRDIYK